MKRAGRHDRRSGNRGSKGLVILALSAIFIVPASAQASLRFTARISPPPEVQHVGGSYLMLVTVRNTGPWVAHFCIDFDDSNNSWKIVMPALKAYDSDTFCYGTLRGGKKQFVARIIAAKSGEKKLGVCVGHATLFPAVNDAILEDQELCWSDSFVIA